MVLAGERGHQHQQRGFRKMEIRDQGVHGLEAVSRIDEDVRPAAALPEHAVIIGGRLQRTAARCAYADDPPALFPDGIDRFCSLRIDHIEFAVHMMLCHVIDLDRPEGPEPYVQCDLGDLHAHIPDLIKKFRCKVKAGGRGGGRAVVPGIDGLVAVFVPELVRDVGRQRHLPELIQNLLEDAFIAELDQTVPVLHDLQNLAGQEPVAEREDRAGTALFSRLHKGLPDVVLSALEKQDLDLPLGAFAHAEKTGGDHAGVVQDQAVARMQEIRDLLEYMMGDLTGRFIQDHQPGGAAVIERILGDQFLRQFIIKV